jgi:hypothetical protein
VFMLLFGIFLISYILRRLDDPQVNEQTYDQIENGAYIGPNNIEFDNERISCIICLKDNRRLCPHCSDITRICYTCCTCYSCGGCGSIVEYGAGCEHCRDCLDCCSCQWCAKCFTVWEDGAELCSNPSCDNYDPNFSYYEED